MDIENITKNLIKKEDGIYYSSKTKNISYPEDGNEIFKCIEERSLWFKHRNNIIKELVLMYLNNNIFFDIGGGNGFVSVYLQNHGIDVILVEPGEHGVRNATKRGVKKIICSTFENAGFSLESISNIGLFDLIEHLDNDSEFLTNLNKYLKVNGLVFITVPAYSFLWSAEDVFVGHFRRYTLNNLSSELKKSGFNIEYATYFFSFLPIPIFLLRTIPSFLKLIRRKNLNKSQKTHNIFNFFIKGILKKVLLWEVNCVKRKKKIPFGSSCLIVASKTTQ
ncbi:MAG: class I SAM-dependent methyltransferase [Bacteroidales bacterium]|nr:class I SAM-dependent methyltransferase [Bacteroidales bacterium]